jgi:hypothetical protein
MGYASTSIVVYGVKISEDIAKKIYTEEFDKNEGMFKDDNFYNGIYFRKLPMSNINSNQQLTPVTPYKHHDEGTDSFVFYPKMWAGEADSRVDSLIYEPMKQHYLGIFIGSNGYAYNDKILHLIRKPPKEAIKNFEDSLRPLMSKYRIIEEPEVRVISQVW